MLTKPSRNRDAADITVDNPAKAMEQFTDGLRHVLSVPKHKPPKPHRARRTRQKRAASNDR